MRACTNCGNNLFEPHYTGDPVAVDGYACVNCGGEIVVDFDEKSSNVNSATGDYDRAMGVIR